MKAFASKYLKWIILASLTLIWGSSFILMKKSLVVYSSIELGALRMVFASMVMFPFAVKGFRKISAKQWYYLTLFALLGSVLPAFLFAKAQTQISSSLAGILNALTPIFVLIIGLLFYKLKVLMANIVGLLMGTFGAVAIIYSSGNGQLSSQYQYAALILLATIFYSININIVKYKLADLNPINISVYGFGIVFLPMLLFLFVFTPFTKTIQQPGALFTLIYPATLGLICSAAAIVAFNTLIKMTSTIFASSITYLIPILALIFGTLDGEKFTFWMGIWIAFIIIGVWMVNMKVKLDIKV